MDLLRKQDLSIFYWLKSLFTPYSFVTIDDGFPDKELENPVVTVESMDFDEVDFELGSRIGQIRRPWSIDIFALNKAQRDEFSYLIFQALRDGIPVYDYDEGFPPSVSPTQIGTLETSDREVRIIRVFPDVTQKKLFWRSAVLFLTRYQPKN
jgi:hypothetical protein